MSVIVFEGETLKKLMFFFWILKEIRLFNKYNIILYITLLKSELK